MARKRVIQLTEAASWDDADYTLISKPAFDQKLSKPNTRNSLIPSLSKAERDALPNPLDCPIIFQTDNTPGLRVYENGAWVKYEATADP